MSGSNLSAVLRRDYDDDDPQAEQIFQSMKSLRIPTDQLQFDEPRQTIGKGGFGIVERAVFNAPNARPITVVVKRIPGRSVSFNRLKKRTGREILIWSKLSHVHIIPFLGYEWNEAAEEVWLVCPWQAKGTIHDYLSNSLASIEQRMKLIIDTGEALDYLHNLNPPVCHGDIKGANVLVTETEDAMLTDFGLSRMLDDSLANLETTTQFQGSIPWCSPELFEEDECIRSPESDVWAWAWLVSEIITGKTPFNNVSNSAKIIYYIMERKWTANPPDTSFDGLSELWNTLTLCWTTDPACRAKMYQCLIAIKALTLPQNYVAPELFITTKMSSSVTRAIPWTEQYDIDTNDSNSYLKAGDPSHQELGGHLAPPPGPPAAPQPAVTPPLTDRQSPSSKGKRSPSPGLAGRGSGGGGRGRGRSPSPRGRNTGVGSRSPSPRPQGIRPNVDLRETGAPRNLTSILSQHQWNSLRQYNEPSSVFKTSLIPNSQVMAIVCVRVVYRTKEEKTAARERLKGRLTQHRRKLLSPNIMHWVGFGFISPWNYACVVRHQDNGSARLPEYLAEHPLADKLNIVKQIANGLECLHSNNVVHGDLRMNTFVVNAAGTVQVAGFDLVELLGIAPEDLFTIRVSPLEILQGSPPTSASDVYAFANVALEVFTGSEPFVKLLRDATVLGALHRGSHSKAESYPDFPHKAVIWELFKQCWDSDPTKRPTMARVIKMLP